MAWPSWSRIAWKYRAYGVARPFSHTTKVGNPSSTAPSHTSSAECEPIVAIRMAPGSYDSRTFRIASRPTIVPVPSRCGPMVPPSLILWDRERRYHGGTSLSADSFRASLDARPVKWWGWGWEDKVLRLEARPALAAYLADRLEIDLSARRPVATFDRIGVPPSRLSTRHLADIQAIVGEGDFPRDYDAPVA